MLPRQQLLAGSEREQTADRATWNTNDDLDSCLPVQIRVGNPRFTVYSFRVDMVQWLAKKFSQWTAVENESCSQRKTTKVSTSSKLRLRPLGGGTAD